MKSFIVFLPVFLLQQAVLSQPVSLSDTANQFDYVIITVPEFKAACEPQVTFKKKGPEVLNSLMNL